MTNTKPSIELLNIVATASCDGPGFCVASADDPGTRHYYCAGWHPYAPAIYPDVAAAPAAHADELEVLLRSLGTWNSCLRLRWLSGSRRARRPVKLT